MEISRNGSSKITFSDEIKVKTEYTLSKEQKFPNQYPYEICIKIMSGEKEQQITFGVYAFKNERDDAFDSLVKKFKKAKTVDENFLPKE